MPPVDAPYRIRRAVRGDIPAMAQMTGDTIVRINSRDYTPRQIEAWAARGASTARWEELWETSLSFFVAHDGQGRLLGVVSVNSRGYLHSLFVHSERQGEGIATALLFAAQDYARARGADCLYSEVSRTARPFFLARGFREIASQRVVVSGVAMENFRMEKCL